MLVATSEPKTLDRAELQGQRLVPRIFKRWSEYMLPGLPVLLQRLDIRSYGDGVVSEIQYHGLFRIGRDKGVEIRFNCHLERNFLNGSRGWGSIIKPLRKPIELRLEGTRVTGSIDSVSFHRADWYDDWQVADLSGLESTQELREQIRVRGDF